MLRDYAEQIGLDPAFTIHDREDSADLMNLVRHQLGLSKTENRFPTKDTCLAIYSRCVNAELGIDKVLRDTFAARTRFIPTSQLPLLSASTWPVVSPEAAGCLRRETAH